MSETFVLADIEQDKHYETAEDVGHIVEKLSAQQFKVIRLGANSYGVEAVEAISGALKEQKELEVFDFSDAFTGRTSEEVPPSLEYLSEALIDMDTLCELNLSDNALGPHGAKSLVDLLTTNRNIKKILLNNNGLGQTGAKIIADALIEGEPSELEVLVCGRNRLEDPGCLAFASLFEQINTLKKISIPQNGITYESFTELAKSLLQHKNLEVLDLYDNNLNEDGAKAFIPVLKELTSLKEINFGDCILNEDLVISVIESISENENIEKLDFTYAEIGNDAVDKIIDLLKDKPYLKEVNFNGNQFSRESVEKLNEAFGEKLGSLSDNEDSYFSDEDDDEL